MSNLKTRTRRASLVLIVLPREAGERGRTCQVPVSGWLVCISQATESFMPWADAAWTGSATISRTRLSTTRPPTLGLSSQPLFPITKSATWLVACSLTAEQITSTALAVQQAARPQLLTECSVMTLLPIPSKPLLLPGRVMLMGLLCPAVSRYSLTTSIFLGDFGSTLL